MTTMTVSEAQAKMLEALERVKNGEEIHLVENGEVVAVWMPPPLIRARVRTNAVIEAEKMLAKFRKLQENPPPLGQGEGFSLEFAEDLIRDIREGRDRDVWERVEAELEQELRESWLSGRELPL